MTQPFANVRILDFTQVLAGPFATWQLALLGADVIKIEPPGGDDVRRTALPAAAEWSARGLSPVFQAINSNKRSLVLNLRDPRAVDVVQRLVRDADVVCENYRPGVMDRLGLGYEALSAINPQLIYCGMSGFGRTGPRSGEACFDGKIQALSGIMTMTGEPEGGPMRPGIALADMTSGMNGAFAMASALYQRSHTGRGQRIDLSMLDSMLNLMANHVAEYTLVGHRQAQYGNLSVSRKATADRFRCGDGYLVLAVLTETQFASLMRTLGHPEAVTDPRFKDWGTRSTHSADLRALIEGAMREGTPEQWAERLTAADVPCSNILGLPDAVELEQLRHRQLLQPVDNGHGSFRFAASAFGLDHGGSEIRHAAPRLGQHSAEVLREAGLDDAVIEAMAADGVTRLG